MRLYYEKSGSGDTVVLLHGMVGSSRYWDRLTQVAGDKFQFISIDLLGFGRSPKPRHITYTYDAHIQSILETLEAAGVEKPYRLVGHSMGALIALRMAATIPKDVSSLVLCGLPYFPNIEIARRDITKSSKVWKMVYYGPTSHFLCTVWCRYLRPITKFIAPIYLPKLPREVAQDSLLHSWQSYAQSLDNVIERQTVYHDIQALEVPAHLLYGSLDTCAEYVERDKIAANNPNLHITVAPRFGHQLPIEKPALVLDVLADK